MNIFQKFVLPLAGMFKNTPEADSVSDQPKIRRETYTVEEAAALLGINRASAYAGVRNGDIPHIKIGKRILIPKAAFDQMLILAETGSLDLPGEGGRL